MGLGFGLLALARPVRAGAAPPDHPTNQRIAISQSYASNADSALAAAIIASATDKSLPAVGAARTFAARIEACPNGGAFYHVNGSLASVRQSLDSTDGVNGTWSELTIRLTIQGGAGRAGLTTIPVTATPSWVQVVCSGTLAGFGFFHKNAAGKLPDLWIQAGASHTAEGMKPLLMRARALAQFATRDPLFLNEAESAQTGGVVRTNTVAAIAQWPEAIGVVVDSVIGNDISAGRPYTSGQATGLSNSVGGLYASIISNGLHLVASDATYRRYPLVNEGTAPEEGALPYNVNVMWPRLDAVGLIDPATGAARNCAYAVMLYYQQTLRDNDNNNVHPTQAGYDRLMDETVRTGLAHYWTGAWPSETTQSVLVGRMEALAASQVSASALPTLYDLWLNASYLVRDMPSSGAKTALQSRVTAQQAWAYLARAYMLVATAESAISQGTKDAAQAWVDGIAVPPYGTEKAELQARINAIVITSNVTSMVSFGTNAVAPPAYSSGSVTSAGQKIANMTDYAGANTGWSLWCTDSASSTTASGGAQTGNNSGAFPDDVLLGYGNLASGNPMEIEVRGLNAAKTYDFEYISSRTSASGTSTCTINGAAGTGVGGTALAALAQSANTANTRSLTNITPIDLGGGVYGIRAYWMPSTNNVAVNGFRIVEHN